MGAPNMDTLQQVALHGSFLYLEKFIYISIGYIGTISRFTRNGMLLRVFRDHQMYIFMNINCHFLDGKGTKG